MTGRGLLGRRTARRMIAAAIGFDAFVAFLFLSAPHTLGGPLWSPSDLEWLIPAAGVVANVVGLTWMIRIYRADPAAHPSFWRSNRP